MTAASDGEPHGSEALDQIVAVVTDVSALVSRVLCEQPMAALAVAVGAGFVAGGGLASPLGMRITSATARSTLGNLTTAVALELVRREFAHGGSSVGPASRTK